MCLFYIVICRFLWSCAVLHGHVPFYIVICRFYMVMCLHCDTLSEQCQQTMHWNLVIGHGKASWNLVQAADKVDLVLEGGKLGGDFNLGKELELGKETKSWSWRM